MSVPRAGDVTHDPHSTIKSNFRREFGVEDRSYSKITRSSQISLRLLHINVKTISKSERPNIVRSLTTTFNCVCTDDIPAQIECWGKLLSALRRQNLPVFDDGSRLNGESYTFILSDGNLCECEVLSNSTCTDPKDLTFVVDGICRATDFSGSLAPWPNGSILYSAVIALASSLSMSPDNPGLTLQC
ncbi:hypothetical protein J6590_067616 [Homalodisca vitripennis]|nr:hypothetical protein J6590_067616 [Homalodisca vitripennis]